MIYNTKLHLKRCVGPGIIEYAERCPHGDNGFHWVPKTGDTASYNGIKNWRCPQCFTQHRILVNMSK